MRWMRWHCPPDTGFAIRALAVWGREPTLGHRGSQQYWIFTNERGRKLFDGQSGVRNELSIQLTSWTCVMPFFHVILTDKITFGIILVIQGHLQGRKVNSNSKIWFLGNKNRNTCNNYVFLVWFRLNNPFLVLFWWLKVIFKVKRSTSSQIKENTILRNKATSICNTSISRNYYWKLYFLLFWWFEVNLR